MHTDITEYNAALAPAHKLICERLYQEISANLDGAESKVWHGAPVWFLDGNPLVGYSIKKGYVALLFWSGQSFDEPSLQAEGSYKAAEFVYETVDQIDAADLERWLGQAQQIQWDYKNIVKRRGELLRLK